MRLWIAALNHRIRVAGCVKLSIFAVLSHEQSGSSPDVDFFHGLAHYDDRQPALTRQQAPWWPDVAGNSRIDLSQSICASFVIRCGTRSF